eukprot:scaffold7202_cov403-Prasinococcus_capsulatus_cf.AAC.4
MAWTALLVCACWPGVGSFRGARTPNEPTTPPRDSPRAVFARDEFVFPSYDSLRRETGATVAAHADGHADGSTQRKLSTTSSRGRPCQVPSTCAGCCNY